MLAIDCVAVVVGGGGGGGDGSGFDFTFIEPNTFAAKHLWPNKCTVHFVSAEVCRCDCVGAKSEKSTI